MSGSASGASWNTVRLQDHQFLSCLLITTAASFFVHYAAFFLSKGTEWGRHHKPREARSRFVSMPRTASCSRSIRPTPDLHCLVGMGSVVVFLIRKYLQGAPLDLWDGPMMIAGIGQFLFCALEAGLTGIDMLWVRMTVAWSAGYFMSDLTVMLTNRKFNQVYNLPRLMVRGADKVFDKFAILHHLLIMPFFVMGIYYNTCTVYHFAFILEEFSTPFLNSSCHIRDRCVDS
eukprot:gene898-2569_t